MVVKLESAFDIREVVSIDGDTSVRAIVVAIRWSRDSLPQYEVSWFHEGRAEYCYFDEWRLSR